MDNIYDRNTRYRVMTKDGYENFPTWHSAYKYAMLMHENEESDTNIYIDKVMMIRTWEVASNGEIDNIYPWAP